MSIFNLLKISAAVLKKELVQNVCVRTIVTGRTALCETNARDEMRKKDDKQEGGSKVSKFSKRIEYPVSLCIEYMKSDEYKSTYQDKPVWHVYVRNFKGSFQGKTRLSCTMSDGTIVTGSPCPICRDDYLLPHYQNIELLKQFVSNNGKDIIDSLKTGVCRRQHLRLTVAIKKAQNYGFLSFPIPHRHYDYSLYYKE